MKIKFKSAWHRKTFTEFITANVKNPYLSRNEYVAAVFMSKAKISALIGLLINYIRQRDILRRPMKQSKVCK